MQIILEETTGKLALARCRYSYHNFILLARAKHILMLKKNAPKSCANVKRQQEAKVDVSSVRKASPSPAVARQSSRPPQSAKLGRRTSLAHGDLQ